MSDTPIKTEEIKGAKIRLNNQIFRCGKDEKFYNSTKTQAYAVGFMMGVEPMKSQVQGGPQEWMIAVQGLIICGKCFDELECENPSAIAKAVSDIKVGKIKL